MERLLQLACREADQAEVYCLRTRRFPVDFATGRLRSASGRDTTAYALRVASGGRQGKSTATSLEREDMVRRALAAARFGTECRFRYPAERAGEVQSFDPAVEALTPNELAGEGNKLMAGIRALDPSIECDASLTAEVSTMSIVNSSGLEDSWSRTRYTVELGSRSAQGFMEIMFWREGTRLFTVSDADVEDFVRRHRLARQRLTVTTGRMPVIFTPQAIWPLLARVFAGVHGETVARGVSPLAGREGEQIFDPTVTIVDDGTLDWGFNTARYDDEGTPTRRTVIVDRGILKGYLFDLRTAALAGRTSTGNGYRRNMFADDVDIDPSPQPSNLILAPGKATLADMIEDMRDGLLVDYTMGGHTGNMLAGEFSLNVATGYLVRNGRLEGKVMDAMVAGNIYDAFRHVAAVGRDLEPIMAVFYGLGYAPAVYFKELNVAGK